MNRSMFTLTGVLLAGALAAPASAVVLTNPGFEADDASMGDVAGATGWGAFNTAFTSTAVTPHNGEQELKIYGPFSPGGGAGVTQGGFAASAGQAWQASAFLRNDSSDATGAGNFGQVQLQFLDADDAVLISYSSDNIDSTSTPDVWTLETAQGIAPAGTATAQIVLVHVQLEPVSAGSVFFDDATLGQAAVPEPASLALLGLGGLALLGRRRRA